MGEFGRDLEADTICINGADGSKFSLDVKNMDIMIAKDISQLMFYLLSGQRDP